MIARTALALSLLALSTAPAFAQFENPRERYEHLRYACDRGDRNACVEMGRAQAEFVHRLHRACDEGDRRACVELGRMEEHRHDERRGDGRDWDRR